MTSPLPDTWAARDFPILRRVGQVVESDDLRRLRPDFISVDVRIPTRDVMRSLVALHDAGYIRGERLEGLSETFIVTGITERGRRAVGLWPSEDSFEALLEGLEQAAERTDDPKKAGALRRAGRYLREAPRDLVVDVVGAVIAKTVTG